MNDNQFIRPVAVLSNRKMELAIPSLPAKVGRNENVVDVYLFHESVSREHCVFECIEGMYTLRDLGSTAGTFINGSRLDPDVAYHVEDGAKIKIGKVKLVFHADYDALAASQQMQAQAAMQAEAEREQARREQEAPREKRITVAARELSDFEYDESEVVMIDCGLSEYAGPMSYTNRLKKEDIEKAEAEAEAAKQAEEEAVKTPEDEAYERLAQAALAEVPEEPEEENLPVEEPEAQVEESQEEVQAEEAAPVEDIKATLVMDPEELAEAEAEEQEAEEAVEADEPENEDEATVSEFGKSEPATLRISWIDEENGDNKSLSIENFPFSIGRKSDENDYSFRIKGMSRKHFHFDKKDGRFTVCDDASTNGVKVNGKKIVAGEDVAIESGDSIRVAGVTFAVRIDG